MLSFRSAARDKIPLAEHAMGVSRRSGVDRTARDRAPAAASALRWRRLGKIDELRLGERHARDAEEGKVHRLVIRDRDRHITARGSGRVNCGTVKGTIARSEQLAVHPSADLGAARKRARAASRRIETKRPEARALSKGVLHSRLGLEDLAEAEDSDEKKNQDRDSDRHLDGSGAILGLLEVRLLGHWTLIPA